MINLKWFSWFNLPDFSPPIIFSLYYFTYNIHDMHFNKNETRTVAWHFNLHMTISTRMCMLVHRHQQWKIGINMQAPNYSFKNLKIILTHQQCIDLKTQVSQSLKKKKNYRIFTANPTCNRLTWGKKSLHNKRLPLGVIQPLIFKSPLYLSHLKPLS